MCRYDVAGVGVGRAEMLHCDLRPCLLVRPVEVQRLGVGREAPPHLVPVYRREGAFPPGGVIDDSVVDEVDFAIDLARTDAGKIADLGDRHPVGNHP